MTTSARCSRTREGKSEERRARREEDDDAREWRIHDGSMTRSGDDREMIGRGREGERLTDRARVFCFRV